VVRPLVGMPVIAVASGIRSASLANLHRVLADFSAFMLRRITL
jgi:hypothetical protein